MNIDYIYKLPADDDDCYVRKTKNMFKIRYQRHLDSL